MCHFLKFVIIVMLVHDVRVWVRLGVRVEVCGRQLCGVRFLLPLLGNSALELRFTHAPSLHLHS